MDLTTLLPLLMMNGKDGDKSKLAPLLKAVSEGGKLDQSALLTSMLDGGGENSQMAKLLATTLSNQKKQPRGPSGVQAITGIANNDIVGRIVKYFLAHRR